MIHWNCRNIQTHEGRAYAHEAYPHIGAPGGPCDAFDYWQYLTIWLQWASRLGKTFFGQCATLKTADYDPCPMMFASSDAKLAKEVVGRTYGMIERCPRLFAQLAKRRRQDLIKLAFCRTYVAWSRSNSTLADKAIRVGHANEIDKWEHHSTSREADPLKQFDNRFKEFPSHKKIKESTPALKHSSRIERGRLASTNCQYFVPCPHCGRYQALRMERIRWDKNEAGKSEKELARRTAHYVCRHCEGKIEDQHRGQMMRLGVWCPEGCEVNDAEACKAAEGWLDRQESWGGWRESPWIVGIPLRDGRDAGYQLSSLYALSLSWGDVAAEFVDSQTNQQNLRDFVNQWLGETWEVVQRKATWETIAQRLIVKSLRRGTIPRWASIATVAVDRQEDGRFPWLLVAWGPGRRLSTVQWGEFDSLDPVGTDVLRPWPHEDGGLAVVPCWTLIDSGYRPDGVYEFCERVQRDRRLEVWPSKGSNRSLDCDYIKGRPGQNKSTRLDLYHVDTVRSQLWADRVLHDLKPDDPGGMSLPNGSMFDYEDFVNQLINDAPIVELDRSNNARENWQRIHTNIPNDYRDCLRYAYVAMLIATRGGPIRSRVAGHAAPQTQQPSRVREIKWRR